MIPAELIKIKRDGHKLSKKQIGFFISGYLSGAIADYQMSAFLMAVLLKGLDRKETWSLTEAMLNSGNTVDLSFLKGPKIDKHSTGGVGDKTSLVIAPIAAVAGVYVPMISGRGLGHTGGTLDKLESIPGFNTQLSLEDFKSKLSELGLCFIGQTKEICPADKRIYSLRDVTGTVECIPLICASIMSKKLAEGIDGLVLDVKAGSGAFMKTEKDAKKLAQELCHIAKSAGKKIAALITQMDQPLGFAIGNSLEVQECLDVLNGQGPDDLRTLCIELAAHMILLGKKAKNINSARTIAMNSLDDGSALKCFEKIVEAQGGKLSQLPQAKKSYTFKATKKGFVSKIDAEKIGLASLSLGAGRLKSSDVIDPSAGIILHKKVGDFVEKAGNIATLYYNDLSETQLSEAIDYVEKSYVLSSKKTKSPRIILGVI